MNAVDSSPNLFIHWDYRNPINRRECSGYTIDRWVQPGKEDVPAYTNEELENKNPWRAAIDMCCKVRWCMAQPNLLI